MTTTTTTLKVLIPSTQLSDTLRAYTYAWENNQSQIADDLRAVIIDNLCIGTGNHWERANHFTRNDGRDAFFNRVGYGIRASFKVVKITQPWVNYLEVELGEL
jgi:hypothetical protein